MYLCSDFLQQYNVQLSNVLEKKTNDRKKQKSSGGSC